MKDRIDVNVTPDMSRKMEGKAKKILSFKFRIHYFSTINDTKSDCTDIDECATEGQCGMHKICENSIGSYQCSCASGFLQVSENPLNCEDIGQVALFKL